MRRVGARDDEAAHGLPLRKRLARWEERNKVVSSWLAARGKPAELGKVHPDDFFEFIPTFVTALPAGQSFSRHCFETATASMAECGASCVEITMDVAGKASPLCEDLYLFGSVETFHVHEFALAGRHRVTLRGLSPVELADLKANGMRVFHFKSEVLADVVAFADTLAMFLQGNLPIGPPDVSAHEAALNVAFLEEKMQITLEPRDAGLVNMSQIVPTLENGDFFGIIRLDGLDPMIAWGMGSLLTGHTVAVWKPSVPTTVNGVTYPPGVYITESQTKSHYWPVNLIQINPIDKWIEMAHAASYNVVHLPLKPAVRAALNESAMAAYLDEVVGTVYGFANFLVGWIDSPDDNYPEPLSLQLVGIVFALLEKISPPTAELMWNQMLNHRLNTTGLDCYQLYAEMAARNLSLGAVLSIPEQDDWRYLMPGWAHPDKPIPASVCDVHVCRFLKAGGAFGSLTPHIQCTEFTNWDVYSLDFYDPTPARPQTCVDADPDAPLCQLMGTIKQPLHMAGSVTPYPHMREHCGGIAPNYYWGQKC
ncbi:uncharacterized protein AMSG_04606 [Thecamonas trahens ATCC 50062]|uniref:Uncharacterized protein n=1 Tax=Thecamonas trahens ATCC 50062 TaxID=461836 RepID=A0A0L0D9U5_THETB|nr:hypothetical protein AMSG_04606 [Thecamonas trahens ATCC 50062]KNC48861.1 hypothetical protein AMSG_04606 [Thecamonas trahens ATCC 50062]|eukprot:XP_013758281.1 hypothetical protein AMSG_04606 [Thecamonas trahens ATCC 50062]